MKVLSKKDRTYLNSTVNKTWKISICGWWAYPAKENSYGYKPDYFIEHIHFISKRNNITLGPGNSYYANGIWQGYKIVNNKCEKCGEEVPAHVKTEYMMEHV